MIFTTIFEITKEGRKLMREIFRRINEKKRLKRVPVSCAWLEKDTHERRD